MSLPPISPSTPTQKWHRDHNTTQPPASPSGQSALNTPSVLNGTGSGKRTLNNTREEGEAQVDKIVVRNGTLKGREVQYYGSEQHVLNMTLQSSVLDNEEAMEAVQDSHIERCIAMRQQLRLGNEKRKYGLAEYDEGYKWCGVVDFDTDDLYRDLLRLKVSQDQIAELGQPLHVPPLYSMTGHLQTLLAQRPHRSHMEAVESDIQNVLQGLTGGRIQLLPSIMQLHEFVHSDVLEYVVRVLEEKEPEVQTLIRQIEQSEFEREEALKHGNIVEAQNKHVHSVELLEDLIMVIRDRLNEVMMGTKDPEAFRLAFADFQTKLRGAFDKFRDGKDNLKGDLGIDVDLIKDEIEKRKMENEDAQKTARTWADESNRKLNENARKQDENWQHIIELVSEMRKLGDGRREEVALHMEMHAKEQERRQRHKRWLAIAQQHLRTLEECQRHTEAALQMVDVVNKYFDDGIRLVQQKKMSETLDEIKVIEQKRYYDVVRQYALIGGDLIDRKEKRLIGLNKLIRNLKEEQQMGTAALDPDTQQYESQARELETKKEGVQRELLRYRENLNRILTDFRETEQMLEEQGIEFVPPSLEVQQQQAKKRQEFLEKRRMQVEAEQDEIAREQREVNKAEARTKVEHEAVKKRLSSLKSSGSTPAVRAVQQDPYPELTDAEAAAEKG